MLCCLVLTFRASHQGWRRNLNIHVYVCAKRGRLQVTLASIQPVLPTTPRDKTVIMSKIIVYSYIVSI